MNDELQAQLLSVIPSLVEQLKEGKDFVIDQAPDVIQQLLAWNFSYSLVLFIIGLVIASVTMVIVYKIHRCIMVSEDIMLNDFGDKIMANMVLAFFALIPLGISTQIIFLNLDWLQIWVAQKIWLIEYASQLVK